ncbi:MAG TPA: carbohydrate kinase [Roseateles sp.]
MIQTRPDAWSSRIGGAGFNVARAMARLGVQSAFAGAVSEDIFGDALCEAARNVGLDMRFLQRKAKSPLLAMVHRTNPPDYFFLGDDSADLHFQPRDLPAGWEKHVRYAHFGGISLARPPLAGCLVEMATRLKAHDVAISYDPNYRKLMDESYDAVLHEMVRLADVIKVSDEDLEGLFRTDEPRQALAGLREMNSEASILFTRGAAGAEYYSRGGAWRALAPEIVLADTIGAGDASVSALLHGLMAQPEADGEQHLRMAVAAGAAACTLLGATPPTLAQVAAIAPHVEVTSII